MKTVAQLEAEERRQIEAPLLDKIEIMQGLLISLGHDLRAPLVTVKTFLGYLQQDIANGDKEGIVKDVEFMNSATKKATRMLEYVLEYSRVGRVIGESVHFTFREISEEAYIATAGMISIKEINFKVIGKSEVNFFADRHRLAQIWQNLIDNAAKYMGDQTEPYIEVGVVEKVEDGKIFFVRDNGIGIDPAHRDRVFSLFSQLNPEAHGSGFGLALVRRIVEFYGGKIWLESEGLGKGTCFYFTLPDALKKV